jgi:hypothetical protein
MSRKSIFIIILLGAIVMPAHAVLKEKDIASTLAILRNELTNYHSELERQTDYMKVQRAEVTSQIISVLQRSQQNAIMLYSQRSGNIFDLTYACHEATEQYRKFKVNAAPFRQYIKNANIEIPFPQRDLHIVSDNTRAPITSVEEAMDIIKKSKHE